LGDNLAVTSDDSRAAPFSKAERQGQGVLDNEEAIMTRRAGLIVSILLLPLLAACHGKTEDKERVTPSGLSVPRYVSLKFDPVNARAGPSDDHRLLWVYHARGMPVQVIAETVEWRRICDPCTSAPPMGAER
jgi:hypothetical protein